VLGEAVLGEVEEEVQSTSSLRVSSRDNADYQQVVLAIAEAEAAGAAVEELQEEGAVPQEAE
jgi:hypothetical protein